MAVGHLERPPSESPLRGTAVVIAGESAELNHLRVIENAHTRVGHPATGGARRKKVVANHNRRTGILRFINDVKVLKRHVIVIPQDVALPLFGIGHGPDAVYVGVARDIRNVAVRHDRGHAVSISFPGIGCRAGPDVDTCAARVPGRIIQELHRVGIMANALVIAAR